MSGLKFLLVCILIKILLSADCLLERFPSELHFSDKLNSPISIDDYVISQYPSYTSDLTPPLTLQRQYSIVNHSKHFVLSVPYPYYVVPVFEQNNVLFEIYDIQTQQLINRTIEYELQEPHKCRFIFLVSYPFDGSSIFTHCTNSTLQRNLMFKWIMKKESRVDILSIYQIQDPHSDNYEIHLMWGFRSYPQIHLIVFLHQSLCQIDTYAYYNTFSRRSTQTCQDIQKESTFQDIRIVDFYASGFNGLRLMIEPSGKLLISQYYSQFYSYWYVESDVLLRVTSLCLGHIVAVVSPSYMYFISIDSPDQSWIITLKEISKIKLGFTFNPQKMKLGTVGQYVIISNGEDWKIYYLSNDRVKVMTYKCQIDVSLIYCDEMLCGSNSFYFQNKKYSIQKMKLINNGTASNRNVTLSVSNCNKVIAIKRQTYRQIQEVNAKQSLICRDNEVLVNHQLCSGHNLTQKLVVNLKQYMLQFKKNQFDIEGDVVEYIIQSGIHIILTNIDNNYLRLYAFCQNQSDFKQFIVPQKTIKTFLIGIQDYYSDSYKANIFTFSSGEKDTKLLHFYTEYFAFNNTLNITIKHETTSSLSLLKLYSVEIINPHIEIRLVDRSNLKFGAILNFKLFGRSQWGPPNNLTHLSYYWNTQAGGGSRYEAILIKDLQIDLDRFCLMRDNTFIMYKEVANLIQIMLVTNIINYYQTLRKKDIKMNAPYRTQCIDGKLAVFSQNNVNIIDETLQSTLKLELSESTINDIITNNLLIHQSSNSIQVYSLENGFMVRRIPSVGINQVVVSSKSQGILLKNGTLLLMEYQNVPLQFNSDFFTEHICFNEFSSILKIKKVISSHLFILPSQKWLYLPTTKFIDNYWNTTVGRMELLSLTSLPNLRTSNHIQVQQISITHIQQDFSYYYYPYGYYQGFIINGMHINAGCTLDYSEIICFVFSLEQPDDYLSSYLIKDLVSISKLYDGNKFIMIYENFTHIDFVKYTVGGSPKFISQNFTCPISAKLLGQEFLLIKPIPKWTYVDGSYFYLYRQNFQDWNSSSYYYMNYYAPYPNTIRNSKLTAKIQVYGLNGQCLLDEITAQMFGVYNKMTDFSMFIRNNQTYLVILCETDVILVKYSYPHNQLTFYKIDLGIKYIKIEAIANYLVLISKNYDHSLYKIYWETFPLGGTLELTKTYIQSSVEEIKGAAISEQALITYSAENIYVYHLNSNSNKAYSSERKSLNDFKLKQKDLCQSPQRIDYVKYISGNRFLISIKGYTGSDCLSNFYFNVSSSIDLKGSDKIRLSNRKYSQEYQIQYQQQMQ